MQQIIKNGSRAVSIYSNGEGYPFSCRVYVNCRKDVEGPASLGDATEVARKFKSLKGATVWANKELAR